MSIDVFYYERTTYKEMCKVSVIMSVYNTKESFLRCSIESILKQDMSDFEFIIINDASDNNTVRVLEEYKDRRIKLIHNSENIGLTRSLNKGIKEARGEYIARMDADDVSLQNRLMVQVDYLDKNINIAAVGSWAFSTGNKKVFFLGNDVGNKELAKTRLLFRNEGLIHPSAMIRKGFLIRNNICYNEEIKKAQDYLLWIDILEKGSMQCLKDVLLLYREHPNQISKKDKSNQDFYVDKIRIMQLEKLNVVMSEKDKKLHLLFCNEAFDNDIYEIEKWIERMISNENIKKEYDIKLLYKEVMVMWFRLCIKYFCKAKKYDFLKSNLFYRTLLPRYYMEYFNRFVLTKVKFRFISWKKMKKICKEYDLNTGEKINDYCL